MKKPLPSKKRISGQFLILMLSAGVLIGTVLTSFKPEPHAHIAGTVKQNFEQDVAALQQEAKVFTQTVTLIQQNQLTWAEGQKAYIRIKQAYKKVEYLLEYLDPELAKSLNGAPLPKVLVEEAAYQTLAFQKPSFRTFPPQGLQVLEEILFKEEVTGAEKKEMIFLAYALEEKINSFRNSLLNQPLTSKQVLASLREELIRIMTLGLSGFDAPAAGHEIENCAVALQSVHMTAALYAQSDDPNPFSESKQAAEKLNAALIYLKQHPDWERFDRVYFIRELLDPAYGALTRLQQQVLQSDANIWKPVNDTAVSLFDSDFLQSAYYAKQDRGTPNPDLINLGKTLFFEPLLSANNQRTCASCHQPNKAFSDGLPRSRAFANTDFLPRNAPTLLNAVFSTAYFWDSRSQYLQDQIPEVITREEELHGNYANIVKKLQPNATYQKLFNRAYAHQSDKSINPNTINRAIAAYVQSFVALNAPFDRYMRRETDVLGVAAKRGFNLFMGKAACGTCHFAPIFNGTVPPRYLESESEILGVPATPNLENPVLDNDTGKATLIPAEVYKFSFKTPTIRNVAVTAPYMHNGVFKTLAEVVEFYDRGGGAGLGLTVPHQTLPDKPLHLTETEKKDLVAFMQSLTDTTTINSAPVKLPRYVLKRDYNKRVVGGAY